VIDGGGKPIGSAMPNFPADITPETILQSLLTTALYPCPPTSGNIYVRSEIEKLFPIPEEAKFLSSDSFLNTLAPLYGRVVTVNKILGCYRTHGRNAWGTSSFQPSMFSEMMIGTDLAREATLRERIQADGKYTVPAASMNERSMTHMQYRLVSRRFMPEKHPVAGETVTSIVWKGLRACLTAPGIRLPQRIMMLIWYLGVGFMPHPIAWEFARMRFSPAERPRFFRLLLQDIGVLRRM
jgi:hypothetical protein